MKKVAALVMTALIVSSFSGCANRNTGYRNLNNVNNRGINQGTTQGIRTGYGTTGTTQGIYRDGIYTGEADRTGGNTQTATVIVSGGRITDITFNTVDSSGRDMTSTTGTTGRTATTPGSRFYGTPGVTTGGANAGMSVNPMGTPNGNTGYAGNDYGIPNSGANGGRMMGGTTSGGNTGWTTGGGTAGGGMTGLGTTGPNGGWTNQGPNAGWTTGQTGNYTGNETYTDVRRQLRSLMINQQSAEVSLGQNETTETRNWIVAVRRALDKARVGGTNGTGGVSGGAGGTGGTTR